MVKGCINIYYNFTPQIVDLKSYKEVLKAIDNDELRIDTLCTSFFSSKYLELGYDVAIHIHNNTLRLSDVLNNKVDGLNRIYRIGHNMEKLLLTGEFDKVLFNIK